MLSRSLTRKKGQKYLDTTWDFRKGSTKSSNHGFHTYPAMMIPQVARRLMETYGGNASTVLDPFMGSGTVLLEASLHKNFKIAYGMDINPLALLISKVKTTPIEPSLLWSIYKRLIQQCLEDKQEVTFNQKEVKKLNFFNIDFWFKPQVIIDLTIIKKNIDNISLSDKNLEEKVKDFFLVSFSETVRRVSNTRNREYKLYRMNGRRLGKHNPNTIIEFKEKTESNIQKMENYYNEVNQDCKIIILDEDARYISSIPKNSIELVVTSPPYGDSRTTVAYGQFSRLSLQWLGYDKATVTDIDKVSLGGIPTQKLENGLGSPSLKKVLEKITEQDPKRARDVLSFYIDFNKCIGELDRVTKNGAFLCFVVGNRTVKGIKIPTDDIIVELFKDKNEYMHHKTIIRNIPSKRMPRSNSPTNVKGKLSSTMNKEYIVVLEKQ